MKHEDFTIGLEFYTAAGKWRCTDVGYAHHCRDPTRSSYSGWSQRPKVTSKIVTDDNSWFHGPPYAVAECVFDEFDIGGCQIEADVFSKKD